MRWKMVQLLHRSACCDGRVVKALDLKSNGFYPRRFEPYSQRVNRTFDNQLTVYSASLDAAKPRHGYHFGQNINTSFHRELSGSSVFSSCLFQKVMMKLVSVIERLTKKHINKFLQSFTCVV